MRLTDVLIDLGDGIDVRVGTDVQSIHEVEDAVRRHGERYLTRLFTAHEIDSCGGRTAPPETAAPSLAARFAAKEAMIKLLRPTTVVPTWKEMEVRRHPEGWSEVVLSGAAAELAQAHQFFSYSLSLTHGAGVGMAIVVGLRRPAPSDGGE